MRTKTDDYVRVGVVSSPNEDGRNFLILMPFQDEEKSFVESSETELEYVIVKAIPKHTTIQTIPKNKYTVGTRWLLKDHLQGRLPSRSL